MNDLTTTVPLRYLLVKIAVFLFEEKLAASQYEVSHQGKQGYQSKKIPGGFVFYI